ncbi:MAG: hypothetical protein VKJ44_09010 [Synechococcus sp.]|nr:hypothetical protein [Synechococcus sp.]
MFTRIVSASRPGSAAAAALIWRLLADPRSVAARRRQAGFVLPFVLVLAAALLLGASMLIGLGSSGLLGAFGQLRSREARQAAEQGVDVILNTLNAPANRRLLVAEVPMGAWGETDNSAKVLNPCLSSAPTAQAVALGKSTEQPIAGDNRRRYVLRRLTLRSPGRSASYTSSGAPGSPAGTATEVGSYADTAIALYPAQPNPGYVEMVVEGRIYDAAGTLQYTAQVTREFAVVPKCCGVGFTAPYGSEAQGSCLPPTLVVGLNGGRINYTGFAQANLRPSVLQTAGWDSAGGASDYTRTANPYAVNNPLLYCSNTSSGCNTQTVFSGTTTLANLQSSAPTSPSYPACNTQPICSQGYAIDNSPTAADDYTKSDYIRVNPAGTAVEICNANTQAVGVESIDFQSLANSNVATTGNAAFNSSCSQAINDYCIRTDSSQNHPTAVPTFHCRISTLTVQDTITATAGNQSLANRRQNNTLWIDTTRGAVYLYFSLPWSTSASPITLVNTSNAALRYSDGQIQHVNCQDSSGNLINNYATLNVCTQEAIPQFWPRAMIYSGNNITMRLGDDGYVRGMRIYLPLGTVRVDYAEGCAPPQPIFGGILWTNNLDFNLGSICTATNTTKYLTGLLVPQGGTVFTTSAFQVPPLYEWVARGSTYTSLF